MFKLIGVIVVLAIVFFGYSSLEKWYEGNATPQETVLNIRDQLGTAIKPNKDNNSADSELGSDNTKNGNSSEDNINKANASPESFSTEKAARELIRNEID